jgi:hypothetical protein
MLYALFFIWLSVLQAWNISDNNKVIAFSFIYVNLLKVNVFSFTYVNLLKVNA